MPLFSLLLACNPPEAPLEYGDLMGYIFSHMEEEDEDALKVGLVSLDTWLTGDQRDPILEGYESLTLTLEAVTDLDGHQHGVDNLSGVSVLTESNYETEIIADALTQYNFKTIIPDVYLEYDREFEEGQQCIVFQGCLWAEGTVYTLADWGILFGEVEADRRIQFRWVETDVGWMFLQRWWLTSPSKNEPETVLIQDQYYIGINPSKTSKNH